MRGWTQVLRQSAHAGVEFMHGAVMGMPVLSRSCASQSAARG